jgi:hypothetical protein
MNPWLDALADLVHHLELWAGQPCHADVLLRVANEKVTPCLTT